MNSWRYIFIIFSVGMLHLQSALGIIAVNWLGEKNAINMQAVVGPRSADLDLDNDGTIDFVLYTFNLVFVIIPEEDNAVLAWPKNWPDEGSFTLRMGEEMSIGDTPPDGYAWWTSRSTISAWNNLGGLGFWLPDDVLGYIGVQFQSILGIHYGWIFLDNSWGAAGGGKILGWAYETEPGVAILAGAGRPSVIPEPGTIGLLIVGLGALSGFRKKRR